MALVPIRYSVRSLGQRLTSSTMTALSVALVVMVLTILLGFVNGLHRTMMLAADPDNHIVLMRGVTIEAGFINHETLDLLRVRPEIATDANGHPLMSPEILIPFDPTPDAPRASTATIRAVLPIAYEVHRNVRIIQGRRPERGKNEWIVGQRLAARFPGLHPGAKMRLGQSKVDFTIVGVFSDNGSTRESEVWMDLNDLSVVAHIPPAELGANVIHLVLKPGYDDQFKTALRSDNRLKVDLYSEQAFYQQAAGFSNQIRDLGLVVAVILAIGSLFGAMNTMYSAVARRRREVGTLRALGFGRGNVLAAFIIESTVLGLCGGLIGEVLAVAVAHATGLESRLMTVGNIMFSFDLPPSAFGYGMVWAVSIGVLGGLLPAWQASRLDVVNALRD
ncbi:MAG TPA: FtsX-like permease family protein [Candidatus Binataceae bacterium]|nr:FtsX-like permease family protein [Candidatus Binataceae bacterium]